MTGKKKKIPRRSPGSKEFWGERHFLRVETKLLTLVSLPVLGGTVRFWDRQTKPLEKGL